MFKIYDGREHFYQWDLDRKLIIEDPSVIQVHFCNRTDDCSLVCETYVEDGITLVNVPNILLQTDWKIRVYAYDGLYTKHEECFEVISRTKPSDYEYTETEILNWSKIEEKVDAAIEEANQATTNAVEASEEAITATNNAIAATGEAEAATVAANEAADRANTAIDNMPNIFANALKGNEEDEIIAIKDISPIEHDIKVKASSKNIFNYKDLVAYANSGIGSSGEEDVEYLGEDCFSFKEWQTSGSTIFEGIPFEDNTQYTFTFEFAFQFEKYEQYPIGAFIIRYTDGTYTGTSRAAYSTKFTSVTITTDAGKTIKGLSFTRFADICTVYVKKNMQIEKGTASTPFTPFIEDITEATISTQGKNLLDIYGREKGKLSSGFENTNKREFEFDKYYVGLSANNYYSSSTIVSYELNDNVWTVVANISGYGLAFPIKVLPSTKYAFTRNVVNGNVAVIYYDSEGAYIKHVAISSTFTTPENCEVAVVVFHPVTAKEPFEIHRCQIEVGATKTDYEPYIEPTIYPINNDGSADGVKSIYPNTTLCSDTPGVLIDAEYNKDLNKAFAELQQAIISLGGNV